MKICQETGNKKYLEPIPAALAYLRNSLLPDGRLARYYELQTNRPLYMQRAGKVYSLTHDDSNVPDHYGWKSSPHLDALEREYSELDEAANPAELSKEASVSAATVRRIIDSLDEQGRWLSVRDVDNRLIGQAKIAPGEKYLSSEVFARNLEQLAAFVRAADN